MDCKKCPVEVECEKLKANIVYEKPVICPIEEFIKVWAYPRWVAPEQNLPGG